MSVPKLSIAGLAGSAEVSPSSPRRIIASAVAALTHPHRPRSTSGSGDLGAHKVSFRTLIMCEEGRRLVVSLSAEEGESPTEFYQRWVREGRSREELMLHADVPMDSESIGQLVKAFEITLEDVAFLLKSEICSHNGEPVALCRGALFGVSLFAYFAKLHLADLVQRFVNSVKEEGNVVETLLSILQGYDQIPFEFKKLMREVCDTANARSEEHGKQLFFNLIFLRLFLPALVDGLHHSDEAKEIMQNRDAFVSIIELFCA